MPETITETTAEAAVIEFTTHRQQCRHIRAEGLRCRSACLRNEPFCYFHHTARQPIAPADLAARNSRSPFDLPALEDRAGIHQAISMVVRRLAANALDTRRAGLLLYGLQIASFNLPKVKQASKNERDSQEDNTDTVEEVTLDPILGAVAPEAPYTPPVRIKCLKEILNDSWKADDERVEAEKAREAEADAKAQLEEDSILGDLQASASIKTTTRSLPTRQPSPVSRHRNSLKVASPAAHLSKTSPLKPTQTRLPRQIPAPEGIPRPRAQRHPLNLNHDHQTCLVQLRHKQKSPPSRVGSS